MSLLQDLIEHPLDDDYYSVVDRPVRRGRDGLRVLTVAVVAGFALLVTVSAVQTRSDRPAARTERAALVQQIQVKKSTVRAKQAAVADLAGQVEELEARRAASSKGRDLTRLRVATGAVAVRGPGVRVVVDSARNADDKAAGRVQDKDLQLLVNGLWAAGAEAIAVNDNRLSTLSSIRTAGEAITVNYRSLARPYVVVAVGDSKTLQARFLDTAGGQAWASLKANLGMRFDVSADQTMNLPAAPRKRTRLLDARALQEAP